MANKVQSSQLVNFASIKSVQSDLDFEALYQFAQRLNGGFVLVLSSAFYCNPGVQILHNLPKDNRQTIRFWKTSLGIVL